MSCFGEFLVKGSEGLGLKKRYIFGVPLWVAEKVYFYKNRANSLSLTPNPFPVGRG